MQDMIETNYKNYDEILELGVINPSFKLFLLLSYDNSADEIIGLVPKNAF